MNHEENIILQPCRGRHIEITQAGRLGDLALVGAIRGHLMQSAIGHTCNELLAFGAPSGATNLWPQDWAVRARNQLLVVQVGHQKIPLVRDNSTEPGQLRGRVRDQGTDCFAIRVDFERRLRNALVERVDVVDGETAPSLSADDEKLLVGCES